MNSFLFSEDDFVPIGYEWIHKHEAADKANVKIQPLVQPLVQANELMRKTLEWYSKHCWITTAEENTDNPDSHEYFHDKGMRARASLKEVEELLK